MKRRKWPFHRILQHWQISTVFREQCEREGRWQKREKTTSEISKCFLKIETRWKLKFKGNILVHQIHFYTKVAILQDKCLRHKCWPSVTAAVSEAARWKRCHGKLPCLPLECCIAMSWSWALKQQCHICVVRNTRCSALGKHLFFCPHCLFQNCFQYHISHCIQSGTFPHLYFYL